MKKERRSENFLPKPTFPGGPRKMGAFIKDHLQYPKDALKEKLEGVVRIKIEIDYKGVVVGTQILSSLSPSCDEEAKRVASLMKFDVDHRLRRGKIRFHKTLNIRFRLPPKPKENTLLKYNITPAKKQKDNSPKKKETQSYTYTITITEE